MEISPEEEELVQKLKSNCLSNGKEINPLGSVEIFHQLGKIYRRKSPDKISLIQSGALFNAALVRQPDAYYITDSLKELCSHILHLAKAENELNLVNLSSSFRKDIDLLRLQVKRDLDGLVIPDKDLTAEEQRACDSQRINDVQVIQEFIAATFSDIMAQISKSCVATLGTPPCRYALVGMGSLAKREVTPYSDFECLIVLEDRPAKGIKLCTEYFRWFAVVFQTILINLGETLVPCVAVPTLNNAYDNDPDTKRKYSWFYDAYTPSGISFDGMVPFACKSPLGRQQHTDDKPWKTELIRTVSDMLTYLRSDEDLKNGYHIADMLTKTCFVEGDESVYAQFYEGVCREMDAFFNSEGPQRDVLLSKVLGEFQEDYEKFNSLHNGPKLQMATKVDIKKFVFRTPTLAVASLARYHCIRDASCFDVVDRLLSMGLLEPSDARKIKLTLAVSCEVRQKVYSDRSAQNDNYGRNGRAFIFRQDGKATTEHLEKLVGQKSLRECLETGLALQEAVFAHFNLNEPLRLERNLPYDLHVLSLLGSPDSDIKALAERKYMDSDQELLVTSNPIAGMMVASNLSEIYPEESLRLTQKLLNQCENDKDVNLEIEIQSRLYMSLSMACFTTKRFGECHEHLQKCLNACSADQRVSEEASMMYLVALNLLHLCCKELKDPLGALEATNVILRLMKLYKYDLLPEQMYYNALEAKAKLLEDLRLTEDALVCLEQCVEWRKRVAPDAGRDNFWCQYQLGLYCCYVKMGKIEEWVKISLQLATGNSSDHFEGGDYLLYAYATAFLSKNQQSIEFCRKHKPRLHSYFGNGEKPVHSPRVPENLGKAFDLDANFVACTYGSFLSLYGETLYKIQRYEEALAMLREAKEQFQLEAFANPENVELNEMLITGCTDKLSAEEHLKTCTPLELKIMAILAPFAGDHDRQKSLEVLEGMVETKNYWQAYTKIMEMRSKALVHFDDLDSKFLRYLAKCLREFGRFHHAIAVCECAIDIRRLVAQNPCEDDTLCALVILLNESHRQLGCSPVKTHVFTPLVSVHAFNLKVKNEVEQNVVLATHKKLVGLLDNTTATLERLFGIALKPSSRQEAARLCGAFATLTSLTTALKVMDYSTARQKAEQFLIKTRNDEMRGSVKDVLSTASFALGLVLNWLPKVEGTKIDDRDHNLSLVVGAKLDEAWRMFDNDLNKSSSMK